MSMTFMYQIAIIPALLITLSGLLFFRERSDDKWARHFLLFLLTVSILLLLAVYIFVPGYDEPYTTPLTSELPTLLMPASLGVLALIVLNLRRMRGMSLRTRTAAIFLMLGIVVLFALLWDSRLSPGYFILPSAFILIVVWSLGRRFEQLPVILGFLALCAIFLFDRLTYLLTSGVTWQVWQSVVYMVLVFLTPSLITILPALLIVKGIQQSGEEEQTASTSHSKSRQILQFILALLLIVYLVYILFWSGVWDQTSDMGVGAFIFPFAGIIAIGTGMVMTTTLRGKSRMVGLLYLILVPLLSYQAYELGSKRSHQEFTEDRADHIANALQKFYTREGHYPDDLHALVPRDLLYIPQPIIFMGERWCYQGGDDYYQLTAFFREFWSMPVSLKLYSSGGNAPTTALPCEDRLAAMKERYYSPMEDPNAMRPPVPTPLPDIEVGLPKTEIYPLLNGAVALPGSWSLDGRYFLFGTQRDGLELHFVIGETGDVCTADVKFADALDIRENTVWLPDGRLLHAKPSGDMTVLTPCQLGSDKLTLHLSDAFIRVMASSKESGRILLESESAFWILDGRTLELMRIPDVTPNPYEIHWDTSTWLAGGRQLVIGRLNGRKGSNGGTTLFLIDGISGEVKNSLDLEGEFGQSAPWIEGLTEEKILYSTQGEWMMADFSFQPVSLTNIIKDIFGLDINFPDEISASGSYVDSDGSGYYLTVRLNHPHNQSTYLYYSRTGQVYVYNHEYHTLLLFPDGYSMDMQKLEIVPTYQDEYDIVMVDDPESIYPHLSITGHTPREYPHLNIRYLPKRAQLAVASAHGVSLVSLSDGKILAYWSLVGDGYSPWIIPSPDGSALIASKDAGGLYYIPLP